MRRTCIVVAIALTACGKRREPTRAEQCRELGRQLIAMADALARGLGDGNARPASEDPEIRQKAAEVERECLAWPDEVFECSKPGANPDSPACREAMAAVTGVVADEPAPDGPPVVATATVGEPLPLRPYQARLATDGTLIAAVDQAIVAVGADGKTRWTTPLDHEGWLVTRADGALLAGDRTDPALVVLDPSTGAITKRIAIPPGDSEYDDRSIEAAMADGDGAILGIADARFFRVTGGRLVQMFWLPDEELDDAMLLPASDGDFFLVEDVMVRRFQPDGTVRGDVRIRDTYGGAAPTPSGALAVSMDDELVLLDLPACADWDAPVVLARKPGRMYIRDDGECAECQGPPPGCVVARPDIGDVDATAPLVLSDGSIVVTGEGMTMLTPDGTKRWTAGVAAFGAIRAAGDTLYALTSLVGDDLEDAPARVIAFDAATGKQRWGRTLDVMIPLMVSSDDVVLEVAGPWLVVGYQGALSWIKLSSTSSSPAGSP